MPRGVPSKETTELTPDEVAAKRAERKRVQALRDRNAMLLNVEKAVRRAREALAEGSLEEHATWLDVASTGLTAYTRTATLHVVLNGAPTDSPPSAS